MNAIGPVSTTPSDRPQAADIKGAARQFEALLIGFLLKIAREDSSEDAAGATAKGYAEEHLARALASTGGLGLANMITTSLENQK
jgi:Rod binding domain-containing protein